MASQTLLNPPCAPCTKSELDLETVPAVQVAIDSDYWVTVGPKSVLEGDGPIEFEIPSSGSDYLDVSRCSLKVTVKVKKSDNTNLAMHDGEAQEGKVTMANLPLHSLFSQVDLLLNDTLVSSTAIYPYRAYLTTLLSYSKGPKETWLRHMEGYVKDEPGKADSKANEGGLARGEMLKNSRTFTLTGRPHIDLFHQNRLLPNGVSMRLRLTRSSDRFFVQSFEASPAGFQVSIKEAELTVRRVKLADSQQLSLEKVISTKGALYPLSHVSMKHFTLSSGATSVHVDSVFSGQMPNRILMGLVENEAFTGHYAKSPFNFRHFNMQEAYILADGQQIPSMPYQFNYPQDSFMEGYASVMRCSGQYPYDWSCDVKAEDYKDGSNLLAFDLTPDESADDLGHVSPKRSGTVKAFFRFREALPSTVTLIVLGQFDNTLAIGRNREIMFDYAG